MRRGPARAQVGFANVTFSYNESSMYLAILMAHIGLCTWEVEAAKTRGAILSLFQWKAYISRNMASMLALLLWKLALFIEEYVW